MRLKKIAAAVLSLSLVCGAVPFSNVYTNDFVVFAESEYTEGTYGVLTYRNYGDYIEITDCDESATKVEIPSEIDGVEVKSIGDYAFYYCTSLESVTINDGITSIGEFAFYYCSVLTSVKIPDSVTSIGDSAFSYCFELTSVTIPESVTSIGYFVARECHALTAINVDEGNKYYKSADGVLFDKDMKNLLQYPEAKKEKIYIIPDSVTDIGDSAFSSCSSLTSVTIPDSVKSIGNGAFAYCSALTSARIPDSVTEIGNGAFACCSALTSAKIPDGVTNIGASTFASCSLLTSVIIPESVESIGNGAFIGCYSLKSVIIPESVTSIDYYAFYSCSSLMTIILDNPKTQIYDSESTITNGYDEYGNIYYDGKIYGYENSTAQAYAKKYDRKFVSLGEYVETILGDVDGDRAVNSSDSSMVLAAYAKTATGGENPLTWKQIKAADVNRDGAVDSSDASSILAYYAYTATGGQGTLEEFLN